MKIIIVLKPHRTATLSEYYEDWANWQAVRAILLEALNRNSVTTEVKPCLKS